MDPTTKSIKNDDKFAQCVYCTLTMEKQTHYAYLHYFCPQPNESWEKMRTENCWSGASSSLGESSYRGALGLSKYLCSSSSTTTVTAKPVIVERPPSSGGAEEALRLKCRCIDEFRRLSILHLGREMYVDTVLLMAILLSKSRDEKSRFA